VTEQTIPPPVPPDGKGLLRQAVGSGAWLTGLASAALVADAFAAIGFAGSLATILDRIAGGASAIAPWLAALCLACLVRAACGWAAIRFAARGAQAIKTVMRRRVLTAAFSAKPGRRLAGELAAAVVDDVEALDGYVVRYLPARAAAVASPVIILAAAALASPIAAGLLAATLVPFVVLMILAGTAAADASRGQLEALARLSGVFADRVSALPLVLAYQAEARATAQVATAARQVSDRTLAVLRIAFVSSAGLEFFAALSVALIAVYAGFQLLGLIPIALPGHLTFVRAFFVLALAPEFYAPMRRLAAAYHERQLGEAAAERIAAFLALPAVAAPRPCLFAAPPAIRFEQAVVVFDDDGDLRLGPFSFEARPGAITALMGPTGSGKTTLLRLLVGEADLTSGEVRVNAVTLAQAGSFAPYVAWAGQKPVLFPGSIARNIALAAPDADRSTVANAAARAGLGELLEQRGGLDLALDERGGGLSGGERRRVGLARAFLKNAPILVLDEPTADLDAASEAAMIAAIRQAAKGRTVLIATHSEAVAAIADQVVRL
jgi:ATP-binding cassette subfamily C protein CydD